MSAEMEEKKIQAEEAVKAPEKDPDHWREPLQNPTASWIVPTVRTPVTSDWGERQAFCKLTRAIRWLARVFAHKYPLQNQNKCAILNKWIFPVVSAAGKQAVPLRTGPASTIRRKL